MIEVSLQFKVHIPNTIIGVGALDTLGSLAKEMKARKVLVITDAGIAKTATLERVKASLQNSGLSFEVFDKCQLDAPLGIVGECSSIAKSGKFDLLVAVGGGSVMDTTKFASVCATNNESAYDMLGVNRIKKAGLRKILIPTTGGTGSEWSALVALTDGRTGEKGYASSSYLWADAVLIDPMTTLDLPPGLTASTAMDALSHAIEAYTTWKANLVSDTFAEKTINLIAENLRTAYAKGSQHIEARYRLAIAAALSMQAVMTAGGTGMVHGMSYPVSIKAHLSHGVSCSLMLSFIMEFNLLSCPAKFARIAELMGEDVEGLSVMDKARKSIEAVRRLSKDVGMPQSLGEVGIKKADIPDMVEHLFSEQPLQIRTRDTNARDMTRDDAAKILEAAIEYKVA
ncbi:MAG: iron-containing alcohol dehydrogenase [Chloroflexi bacterium]|nr:iron-containing alcohol dehydrogenase [Chloroflexota bacterium]